MKNETLYSKLVSYKKRYIKKVVVPGSIAKYIDAFFNEFHNIIIQSKDRTRDIIIKSKDVTRDVLIKSKDVVQDGINDTKKISQSTKILAPGETLPINHKLIFPFLVIFNIFVFFYTIIRLLPYSVNEDSDKRAVKSMNKIIANSQNIKNRIAKYYNRESIIINPPVTIQSEPLNKVGKFWLSVNRLTPEKRVDIQINTFKRLLNERLIIVGGYDDNSRLLAEELFKNCPDNVSFVGRVDEQTLESLYLNCKGLLTTSIDEDFGMNVVEAMSFGKPVIAPDEGGYKETILNNITGILIDDVDTNKIINATQMINTNLDLNKDAYFIPCLNQANKFSESNFTQKIKKELSE